MSLGILKLDSDIIHPLQIYSLSIGKPVPVPASLFPSLSPSALLCVFEMDVILDKLLFIEKVC